MKQRRKQWLFAALVLVMVAILVGWWWRGYQQLRAVKREVARLEEKIDSLITANEALRARIEHVDDAFFIEREAREKLGLARENEIVYIFRSSEASGGQRAHSSRSQQ